MESLVANLESYRNLIRVLIGSCDDALPVDTAQFMDNLLGVLDERRSFVICKHFGLDGDAELTLLTIGELLGVTRERVRQIEAEALRKLRSNKRREALIQFVQAKDDIRQKMLNLRSDRDFVRWAAPEPPTTIEDLELSVRAYNMLKNRGVYSLTKLPLPAQQRAGFSRKCGKKVIGEIVGRLACFDLRLFEE